MASVVKVRARIINCWMGQYDFTKTPPTYHVKVPRHPLCNRYTLFQPVHSSCTGRSLMLESPDYFFRPREIGRLRQTNARYAVCAEGLHFSAFHFCCRFIPHQYTSYSRFGGAPYCSSVAYMPSSSAYIPSYSIIVLLPKLTNAPTFELK